MDGTLKVVARLLCAVAAVALAAPANATPVYLSGSYSGSAGSISGSMQGDYAGNVLTLDPVPYSSILTINLAAPTVALPNPILVSHGAYCAGFQCTIRGYLNASYSYGLTPWNFDIGGYVEFDGSMASGGMAYLTTTPIPIAQIGSITGTATPTFTVTADPGQFAQGLADLAASTLQSGLNLGNWHVSVDGAGFWDSVDPGIIALSRTENAGLTTLGISVTDMILDGAFSYNSDLTFDRAMVELVGSSFVSTFRGAIDNALTGVLVGNFYSAGLDSISSDDYAADCSASQTGNRSVAVSCSANATFGGTFYTPPSNAVPEPATSGLIGLGLAGLIWIRSRRVKELEQNNLQ